MSGHLGDDVAAFLDGELDFPRREKALEHLSRCAECRDAVEGQRAVKGRVQRLPGTEPSAALLPSLLRIPSLARLPAPAPAETPRAPVGLLRRGALLLAGAGSMAAGFVAVAYVVGGPTASEHAPVSPPVGQYSAQFAGSEGSLPFSDPAMDVLPVLEHRSSVNGP